ncbi:MAG: carbohydrate ABC transporter permease [Anaerolineales bacterium]|nr:carbohydrate ABC transporter permease [Anaerolineales bacterium]
MSRFRLGLHHALALLATAVFLLPLFWMAVNSLRPVGLPPPQSVEWWPTNPSWSNYPVVFEMLPMLRYIRNSVIVVATAVPITLIVASLAGFSMSQLPYRPRRRLFIFSVVMLMIPSAAVWLFRFQILSWLGLIDSLWALILPAFAASNPLFVLLFYWSFHRIPSEMFDAARLDGSSAFMLWRRLALPLVMPTAVAVAILTFALYWSDFISPVLYIYDPQSYTLPVGLQILKQLDPTNWPLLMTGAVLMTLPIILLFMLLQRFFLNDMSLANLFERN